MTKYSMQIELIGDGRYQANNQNAFWLINGTGDILAGATGQGGSFSFHLSPWTASGVSRALTWGTGFWPLLRSLFVASGFTTSPSFFAMDNENTGDTAACLQLGATGWFDRAKADARWNTVLFDGTQTVAQYMNRTWTWYDGTPIATGVTQGGFYTPEDAQCRHIYDGLMRTAYTYAMKKGIQDPMNAQFGNVPVFNFNFFKASSGVPVPYVYPNYPAYLFTDYYLAAQSPVYYSDDEHTHDSAEDDVPPYWDSATGWQRIYPVPQGSNYTANEYAVLQYGINKLTKAYQGASGITTIPWVGLIIPTASRIALMKEVLKAAYAAGIRNFQVFESTRLTQSVDADAWYDIIRDVNAYVDNLNTLDIYYYKTATVCKTGGGFLKI